MFKLSRGGGRKFPEVHCKTHLRAGWYVRPKLDGGKKPFGQIFNFKVEYLKNCRAENKKYVNQ